jgi:hypothetical protein
MYFYIIAGGCHVERGGLEELVIAKALPPFVAVTLA